MVRLSSILAIAAATIVAGSEAGAAVAGTSDGKFAVEEAGRVTCESYLKSQAAKSPAYAAQLGFIQGYITAANRYEPDTFDLSPWQNAQAFSLILTAHCRQAPKDTLAMVAQKLVVTMRPTRLAEYSDTVVVGDQQTRRPVYKAVLIQAQSALTKKGLYEGPVDGRYTPRVKAALEAFQKSAKLQATGVPDTATLWVLLNP